MTQTTDESRRVNGAARPQQRSTACRPKSPAIAPTAGQGLCRITESFANIG
jgi:hypothetical protein